MLAMQLLQQVKMRKKKGIVNIVRSVCDDLHNLLDAHQEECYTIAVPLLRAPDGARIRQARRCIFIIASPLRISEELEGNSSSLSGTFQTP
eukprot:COSAG01_NODE_2950_length_6804_cov_89.553318_5_plen_91_part_00